MRPIGIGVVAAGIVALGFVATAGMFALAAPSVQDGPGVRGDEGVFDGFCEASAIVAWQGGFLVADNETDDRLYARAGTMAPGDPLALTGPVEDIEALAVGPAGQLLVVGSQSANKKGKRQPERELLLVQGHAPVRPDLSACAPCVAAQHLPPKEGGLSVEGAAWWQAGLWLGVRSPLVDGEALLLRLDGDPTRAVAVTETLAVDLGGAGIRDLVPTTDGLYLLAGPTDGRAAPHRLYRMRALGAAPERLPIELPAGSEGLVWDGTDLLVVTDGDGKPGEGCKAPATWVRVPIGVARPG